MGYRCHYGRQNACSRREINSQKSLYKKGLISRYYIYIRFFNPLNLHRSHNVNIREVWTENVQEKIVRSSRLTSIILRLKTLSCRCENSGQQCGRRIYFRHEFVPTVVKGSSSISFIQRMRHFMTPPDTPQPPVGGGRPPPRAPPASYGYADHRRGWGNPHVRHQSARSGRRLPCTGFAATGCGMAIAAVGWP